MWSRREPFEGHDTDKDSAWVLLAETRTVRLYGRRRPASLGDALKDRERAGGNPRAERKEMK
jgi:hypothetical protein